MKAQQSQKKAPYFDTGEAFAELDIGDGYKFRGSTEDLFAELMEDL